MNRLCIYCGSSMGSDPLYREEAARLGAYMARRGIELVYGGATMGLMGVISQSCLEAGGRVTGVIPEHLIGMGVARENCTKLVPVKDMHHRKAVMMELADGFIALPGGPGTMEEAFEVFAWMQLGIHGKPLAFYDMGGFYGGLMAFLRTMHEAGFLRREHLEYCIVGDDPAALVDSLERYVHRSCEKWEHRESHQVL